MNLVAQLRPGRITRANGHKTTMLQLGPYRCRINQAAIEQVFDSLGAASTGRVMGDDHYGRPRFMKLRKQVQHFLTALHIEIPRGLIGEQQ